MFNSSDHKVLKDSIETIGAGFAIFEKRESSDEFVLISANSIYENIIIGSVEDGINKSIKMLFPSYSIEEIIPMMNEVISSKSSREIEIINEYKSSTTWWRSIYSPVFEEDLPVKRIINTCIDITDKKKLEERLQIVSDRYEAVVQSAYDGIISIDEQQHIMLINKAAGEIFGVKPGDVIGTPLTDLMPARYRERHVDYVHHFKKSTIKSRPMQERSSITGLRADGSEVPLEVTISKIYVDGKLEMTAVIRDISEKSILLEELLKLSRVDGLTKLYNRAYFTTLFGNEIERNKRYKNGISIIMFDLDHFKLINDTYGHGGGDYVLMEVSNLIINSLRRVDTVARWGGEEFIVLLPETDKEIAVEIAEKLRLALLQYHFEYQGNPINVTASFGVASCTIDCETIDKMIKYADDKLYEAKGAGRNRVSY